VTISTPMLPLRRVARRPGPAGPRLGEFRADHAREDVGGAAGGYGTTTRIGFAGYVCAAQQGKEKREREKAAEESKKDAS